MNVFELSLIASPVVGGISGAVQGGKVGTLPAIVGILIGVLIGAGLYCILLFLTSISVKLFKLDQNRKLNLFQCAASHLSVLFPGACPLLTFYLVNIVIKTIYSIS